MRCLAFKLPAEGVSTTVPHNFKVLQGLSDQTLMHQWREATPDSTSISSLEGSRAGSSSDDSGSEDVPSPGAKSPSSINSINSYSNGASPAAPAGRTETELALGLSRVRV